MTDMGGEETQTMSLLRRWHSGDAAALGDLVRRDLPWIRSHVKRRLGAGMRKREETGDIVQEAMMQVLKDGPKFVVSDTSQFRRLVAAIVENVIRGRHRASHQQQRDVSREESFPTAGVLDLDATSPSEAAMRSEDAAWLELCFQLLDADDREVIDLRQWQGLSFAAVGAAVGIEETHARVRFHRALGKMAPLMRRLRSGELAAVLAERR